MHNEQIKKISFAGIVIAIIVILTFSAGFLSTHLGISITLVHIPVLIGGIILGKKYGALFGFVFGACSMVLAFFNIATNAPFTNPLVSILPRIIFGFAIEPIYNLLNKLIKNDLLTIVLTMIVATLFHSIIVISAIYVAWYTGFYFGVDEFVAASGTLIGVTIFKYFYILFISNGILEVIVAAVVGTPIIKALNVLRTNKYKEI